MQLIPQALHNHPTHRALCANTDTIELARPYTHTFFDTIHPGQPHLTRPAPFEPYATGWLAYTHPCEEMQWRADDHYIAPPMASLTFDLGSQLFPHWDLLLDLYVRIMTYEMQPDITAGRGRLLRPFERVVLMLDHLPVDVMHYDDILLQLSSDTPGGLDAVQECWQAHGGLLRLPFWVSCYERECIPTLRITRAGSTTRQLSLVFEQVSSRLEVVVKAAVVSERERNWWMFTTMMSQLHKQLIEQHLHFTFTLPNTETVRRDLVFQHDIDLKALLPATTEHGIKELYVYFEDPAWADADYEAFVRQCRLDLLVNGRSWFGECDWLAQQETMLLTKAAWAAYPRCLYINIAAASCRQDGEGTSADAACIAQYQRALNVCASLDTTLRLVSTTRRPYPDIIHIFVVHYGVLQWQALSGVC